MQQINLSIWFVLFFALVLSFSQNARAQELNAESSTEVAPGLRLQSMQNEGTVMLRWAPTISSVWNRCNEVGYVITRTTVMRNGRVTKFDERLSPTILRSEPIKPMKDEEQWVALMDRIEAAGVAAQALYGESFTVEMADDQTLNETMINAQLEDVNRFNFGLFAADQSFEVARAMGLAMIDSTIKNNENYVYKVFPALDIGMPTDTGFSYVRTGERVFLPKVIDLKAEFSNLAVMLNWDIEVGQQFYTSYNIEQSLDGVSWQIRNSAPFVPLLNKAESHHAFFADTLPYNNQPIFYRVQGKTIFDAHGPYSDVVQGSGKGPLPSFFPEIKGVVENELGHIDVQWVFNESEEDKIRGFNVLRSETIDGTYERINTNLIPPSVRFFTDSFPNKINYYKITGIDNYGRPVESFAAYVQLHDETPPAAPLNVRGRITNKGELVIVWDKNIEPDFFGNRVFLGNHPDAEFSQITREPVTEGYFIDKVTLNTLTENVYIQVTSLDYHHNTSAFSEIVKISRPDTIAPSAPRIIGYESTTSGIHLAWINSSSTDVERQDIYRSELGQEDWILAKTFIFPADASVDNYFDTTTVTKVKYEYKITAVDEMELMASSNTVQVQMIHDFVLDSIEIKTAEIDRRNKQVKISWIYPLTENLEYFQIYRSYENGTPVTYDMITYQDALTTLNKKKKFATYQFVDRNPGMNTNYSYRIKAKCSDGSQSPMSQIISINY